MTQEGMAREQGVAVLAPTGRDGLLVASMLQRIGVDAFSVADPEALCAQIDSGIGAAVITEEALRGSGLEELRTAFARQPLWSDLPVILLTGGKDANSNNTWGIVKELTSVGNVSLLERPLRAFVLSSAVEVALRSRRRQYEAKSLYEDLEKRVEERSSELIAKNRELEGFTYSISHDLRTPLRAIVSRARIVLEEESGLISPEGVENLERLALAANRMSALVDDLLKYARIGMQPIAREHVNLQILAEELVEEIHREQEDCEFSYDLAGGEWADCDSRLVAMALRNLFDNACKYCQKGKAPQVEFGSQRVDRDLVFHVSDKGIGFDMRYVGRLFKPFERLHREEYPGTGIGLANVRRVVERHSGRVWVESEPGIGTTFYFTLA